TQEEMIAWTNEGKAWSIGVGYGDKEPGKWPGHLAVIVKERILLDLSLDQADRPAKHIRLPPLMRAVQRPENLLARHCDCILGYEFLPDDTSYSSPSPSRPCSRSAPTAGRISAHGSTATPAVQRSCSCPHGPRFSVPLPCGPSWSGRPSASLCF